MWQQKVGLVVDTTRPEAVMIERVGISGTGEWIRAELAK